MAYQGLTAASTAGSLKIQRSPSTARVRNQIIMIGPKSLPIPAVPRLWIRNRPIRMAMVIGTT